MAAEAYNGVRDPVTPGVTGVDRWRGMAPHSLEWGGDSGDSANHARRRRGENRMPVLIPTESELRASVGFDAQCLRAIEDAFTWLCEGKVEMPRVMHIELSGGFQRPPWCCADAGSIGSAQFESAIRHQTCASGTVSRSNSMVRRARVQIGTCRGTS